MKGSGFGFKTAAKGILMGLGAWLIMVTGLCALVAWMVLKETMAEASIPYGVMAILGISSFCGAMIAWIIAGKNRVFICAGEGIAQICVMALITLIFFDGAFSGMGANTAIIVCGAALAILPGLRGQRHEKMKHTKRSMVKLYKFSG